MGNHLPALLQAVYFLLTENFLYEKDKEKELTEVFYDVKKAAIRPRQ